MEGLPRANQARIFNGKDNKFKFFYSAQEASLGGAGILLAESWSDKLKSSASLTESSFSWPSS